MNDRRDGINRREFLNRLTLLGSLLACYPTAILAQSRSEAQAHQSPGWLKKDPWKTLSEVQEHLFPAAADTPGASDIHAIVYLHNTIENPAADGDDKEFLFNGVGWLNDLARGKTVLPFDALDEQQKESLLRQIEQSRAGRNWLSLLLTYVLEALLADPVYGGNPDGIGWKWLEHQPGYPRPPADKSWYKLATPVRYQRKA
ncbi:MAG: gluconate 2-dehydrogenase subunit 3 family protein [Gammaproteobacteria bacterium]|nr:gluconate 2-dehydrogenase subunit 3 family protein [Gammaproteobacteria bacterium]